MDNWLDEKPARMTKRQVQYNRYLKSKAWKRKRLEAFSVHGEFCSSCGYHGRALQVHHKTYERFGNEEMADLEVLCTRCHEEAHKSK